MTAVIDFIDLRAQHEASTTARRRLVLLSHPEASFNVIQREPTQQEAGAIERNRRKPTAPHQQNPDDSESKKQLQSAEHGYGYVPEAQRMRAERYLSLDRFDTQTNRQSWPATGSWQGDRLGDNEHENASALEAGEETESGSLYQGA